MPQQTVLLVLCILLLCGLGLGCTEAPDERFDAQINMGYRVTDSGGLVAWFRPGGDMRVGATDDGVALAWRASAPTPTLRLDRRVAQSVRVRIVVENVLQDAAFVPTISDLQFGSACPDAPQAQSVLGPLPTLRSEGTEHELDLVLPGCSRTLITVVPGAVTRGESIAVVCDDTCATAGDGTCTDGGEGAEDTGCGFGTDCSDCGVRDGIKVAVLGENRGNFEVLDSVMADAVDWGANFAVVLGNLTGSSDEDALLAWRESAEHYNIPLVVALGEQEVTSGGRIPFHDVFGRSDLDFAVEDARFFLMDTASAELSDTQFEYWSETLQAGTEAARVAFMQLPPYDWSGNRNHGFRNRAQAARLVSILGEGAVSHVFAGQGGNYRDDPVGGIRFITTGGTGRALEALADVDHHYVRLVLGDSGAGPISVSVQLIGQ